MQSLQGSHLSQGGAHESSPLPEKLLVVADLRRGRVIFFNGGTTDDLPML